MPASETNISPVAPENNDSVESRSEMQTQFAFRCCIFPRDGRFCGECIDLDIAVRGASPLEVQRSLEQAIVGYLKTVTSAPEAREALSRNGAVPGLLPRRAPLFSRLRYYWLLCKATLTRGQSHDYQIFDCALDGARFSAA